MYFIKIFNTINFLREIRIKRIKTKKIKIVKDVGWSKPGPRPAPGLKFWT